MKKIILMALLASSTVFANSSDLKLFNTLIKRGVSADSGMSKYKFVINDVLCQAHVTYDSPGSYKVSQTNCTFKQDNEQNGELFVLKNDDAAKRLMSLLQSTGNNAERGPKFIEATSKRVVCTQVNKGVTDDADQSEANRTFCNVE